MIKSINMLNSGNLLQRYIQLRYKYLRVAMYSHNNEAVRFYTDSTIRLY